MPSQLEADLEKLEQLAYHRREWSEPEIERYHRCRLKRGVEAMTVIEKLYRWMFVPTTLWPFNIHHVFGGCLSALERGKRLSARQILLIKLLSEPPEEAICAAVAEHEHHVQKGTYENLLKAPAKFAQNELAIASDPELLAQWGQIKAAFKVDTYRDYKGVIRRTMGAERNLRPSFSVNLRSEEEVFRAAFDAFCLRWNLYGMQKDEPLLLKLSINVTPYGTMILIPSYWSLDPKRDIRWGAIAKLHRTRVTQRQGSALAEGLAERRKLAKKLRRLDEDAKRLKLKGEPKHTFLCEGLGWVPETSPKRISRLRVEFKK